MFLEQTPDWLVSMFELPGWAVAINTYYRHALQRLSSPWESHLLKTRYGDTHLLAAGDSEAPPIVLLHGRSVNATVWRDYIDGLSQDFRVYAIDILGEGGKSAPVHPFSWNSGYARWLCEVLDQLNVIQAHVVGMSFGGWLSLKLAMHAPERVRALSLLAPGGFIWASLPFVARGVQAAVLPHPERTKRFVQYLSGPDVSVEDEDCQLLHLVFAYHRANPDPPTPFTNAQLSRLEMPVQLLIGEHDPVFLPKQVMARATRTLPNLVDAGILPGVGHGILSDKPQLVYERVTTFVVEQSRSERGVN